MIELLFIIVGLMCFHYASNKVDDSNQSFIEKIIIWLSSVFGGLTVLYLFAKGLELV
tara:strand:+ start:252 stop:422 length:171 start_codon:yes stop_codon:yes gene_type:complete